MEKEPYETRTKRITVAVPKQLFVKVQHKLQYTPYTNISELIRELLRQWAKDEPLTLVVGGGTHE